MSNMPNKRSKYQEQYREKNRELLRARKKIYYETNKGKIKASQKSSYEKYKYSRFAQQRNRYHRDRRMVIEKYGGKCV